MWSTRFSSIMLLTKTNIENMDESTLRTDVLIPLLEKMGYKDISERHGATEFGKDIVCWKANDVDGRRYLAVVAKAKNLQGSAAAAREVAGQVLECFNVKGTDPAEPAREFRVHEVWVVSNKKITEPAQNSIIGTVGKQELTNYVTFIDKTRLWGLVKQFLPTSILAHAIELQKRAKQSDSDYMPLISVDRDRIKISIAEKHPGAAAKCPIRVGWRTADADAAKQVHALMIESIRSGRPATISGQLIAEFHAPDFVCELLGVSRFEPSQIVVSPIVQVPNIRVAIRISSNAGTVEFPNTEMRVIRQGTEEFELEAHDSSLPFTLGLALSAPEKCVEITIGFGQDANNAVQYLQWLQLNLCASQPFKLELIAAGSGITAFTATSAQGMTQAPPEGLIQFHEALAMIQRRTKRPIMVPNRKFSAEEVQEIEEATAALMKPHQEISWTSLKATFAWHPGMIDELTLSVAGSEFQILQDRRIEQKNILGVQVDLGTVCRTFRKVRLRDRDAVFDAVRNGKPGDTVVCYWDPAPDDDICVVDYLDWLDGRNGPVDPTAEAKGIEEGPVK
jgi:hypothetical protein